MPGPLLPSGSTLCRGSARPSSARDPSQSRGRLPGMLPSLLAQPRQPGARPSSPPRHRWGLLLKAVLSPRAPRGFHPSGRRFHKRRHGLCRGMQPRPSPGEARSDPRDLCTSATTPQLLPSKLLTSAAASAAPGACRPSRGKATPGAPPGKGRDPCTAQGTLSCRSCPGLSFLKEKRSLTKRRAWHKMAVLTVTVCPKFSPQ